MGKFGFIRCPAMETEVYFNTPPAAYGENAEDFAVGQWVEFTPSTAEVGGQLISRRGYGLSAIFEHLPKRELVVCEDRISAI